MITPMTVTAHVMNLGEDLPLEQFFNTAEPLSTALLELDVGELSKFLHFLIQIDHRFQISRYNLG